jgi:inosine-uridine nucleoside N-ribohydrolase
VFRTVQKLTLPKGVDDVLAILLALAAKPEELDVLMISITYGNVEVQRSDLYLEHTFPLY